MMLSMILAVALALQSGVRVVLHWQPPAKSSDAVVGYNVYRMDTATSVWVRINKKPVRSPAYTDQTAQRGHAYSYSIRSVDSQGKESAPSNPWSVNVPKNASRKVIEAKRPSQ